MAYYLGGPGYDSWRNNNCFGIVETQIHTYFLKYKTGQEAHLVLSDTARPRTLTMPGSRVRRRRLKKQYSYNNYLSNYLMSNYELFNLYF